MVLLVILKCKTLVHQDSINKAKRQFTDWHKIVTADPGLEPSQISKNDTNNPRNTAWDTKAIHRRGNPADP